MSLTEWSALDNLAVGFFSLEEFEFAREFRMAFFGVRINNAPIDNRPIVTDRSVNPLLVDMWAQVADIGCA